jgi:hypothetical protein
VSAVQFNTLHGAFKKSHRIFGADDDLCATTARRYLQEVVAAGGELEKSIEALLAYAQHDDAMFAGCSCGLAEVLGAVTADLERWAELVKLIDPSSGETHG